jgi:hypothetical protein
MRCLSLRRPLYLAAVLLVGCGAGSTAPDRPSYFSASVTGSVQTEYEGSGSFRLLGAQYPGPRYSLHSRGTGTSSEQGFAFIGMDAPSPGEHPIGEVDATTYLATYWNDEGQTRRIFRASGGAVLVSEQSESRAAGAFTITAKLALICSLQSAFPAPILDCEHAPAGEMVEITGTFDASPLGGESPGLHPY